MRWGLGFAKILGVFPSILLAQGTGELSEFEDFRVVASLSEALVIVEAEQGNFVCDLGDRSQQYTISNCIQILTPRNRSYRAAFVDEYEAYRDLLAASPPHSELFRRYLASTPGCEVEAVGGVRLTNATTVDYLSSLGLAASNDEFVSIVTSDLEVVLDAFYKDGVVLRVRTSSAVRLRECGE